MIRVTIVVFDFVLSSAVSAMNELLYFAGNVHHPAVHPEEGQRFSIKLASWDGKPVKTMNQVPLSPHCAIPDIEQSDVWLVPSIAGDIERTLEENGPLIQFLRKVGQTDAMLGSNSSGAFFLAEAGLLDGKLATTHRSNEALFRQRYPDVKLQFKQRLTHDGSILTERGGMSWFDMGLYLVELFCGRAVAAATAEYYMVDNQRSGQLSFAPASNRKQHNDNTVLDIQHWMESRIGESIALEDVVQRFGLSNRSLIRRFKQATGQTPIQYLQKLRLEEACKLLLHTGESIELITSRVGYEDISSFARLFKRRMGMSPGSYRAKFSNTE